MYFKQKTAYAMRISDWSSDVCSSDLRQIAQTCDAKIFRPVPGTGQKAALQHRHAKQHETQRLRARKSEQVDLFTAQQDEAMEHKDGIATLLESDFPLLYDRICRSEERRVGKKVVRTCSSRWSRNN